MRELTAVQGLSNERPVHLTGPLDMKLQRIKGVEKRRGVIWF